MIRDEIYDPHVFIGNSAKKDLIAVEQELLGHPLRQKITIVRFQDQGHSSLSIMFTSDGLVKGIEQIIATLQRLRTSKNT